MTKPPSKKLLKLPPRQTPCATCPLKKLESFRVTSDNETAFIEHFKSGELITDVGATILAEGSSGPHLYTVLTGWAFRYKSLADGRRQILNFVLPGDFLGLQGTMLSEMQHSVEALTPMALCVFPRDKLWNLYANYPSLAFDLTWLASRSERLLDENLLSVGRRSAAERVAYVLLDVFRRCRALKMTNGNRLELPFTQQHLADALGMSLVHTNKTLHALSGRRLFRWKAGIFELLDEERMMAAAHAEPFVSSIRPLI